MKAYSGMDSYALMSVSDFPAPSHSMFGFRYFNLLQSECYPACFLSNINLVISAPTGSGKTIYVALSKALVLVKQKLGSWGLVAWNSQKFDAVTRYCKKDGVLSFFSDISLLLIDEVCLLMEFGLNICFSSLQKFDAEFNLIHYHEKIRQGELSRYVNLVFLNHPGELSRCVASLPFDDIGMVINSDINIYRLLFCMIEHPIAKIVLLTFSVKKGIPHDCLEKHTQDESGSLLKPFRRSLKAHAKYYFIFNTMKHLLHSSGNRTIADVIHVISHDDHMSGLQLRCNEKNLLNDLNTDKEGQLQFHVLADKGKKKMCIQTGDPAVCELSLNQDMNAICTNGCRISKSMKEYFIYRKNYKEALNRNLLAKSLNQKDTLFMQAFAFFPSNLFYLAATKVGELPRPRQGKRIARLDMIFEEYVCIDIHQKIFIKTMGESGKRKASTFPLYVFRYSTFTCTPIRSSFNLLEEELGEGTSNEIVTQVTEDVQAVETDEEDCKIITEKTVFDHIHRKANNLPFHVWLTSRQGRKPDCLTQEALQKTARSSRDTPVDQTCSAGHLQCLYSVFKNVSILAAYAVGNKIDASGVEALEAIMLRQHNVDWTRSSILFPCAGHCDFLVSMPVPVHGD
ncbi:Sec63 domain [Dillenia turbinata]|uniref:Sec63 domain n=1 Tax=Dillenia turbinata TaxID=194707 RepID=A0AAN8UCG2_9MAGN